MQIEIGTSWTVGRVCVGHWCARVQDCSISYQQNVIGTT